MDVDRYSGPTTPGVAFQPPEPEPVFVHKPTTEAVTEYPSTVLSDMKKGYEPKTSPSPLKPVAFGMDELGIQEYSLRSEEWREYDFPGRVYRIQMPRALFYAKGSTTHRILDCDGVVHCVPAPGHLGCVLRWKAKEGHHPCAF